MVKHQYIYIYSLYVVIARDVATIATCVAEALRQDCLEQVTLVGIFIF